MWEYTIHKIQDLVRTKKISIKEITKDVLNHIKNTESSIRAYIHLCDEKKILKAADDIDNMLEGERKDLYGIPMALQDDICTSGVKTTCGSKILENFVSPYDAQVVRNMREENCILLGKTNLDAFGVGASTENSVFYTTHNPLDWKRVPGGSGGAAAVSSGEAFFALGSDTGGALRQSASFCGIVGLKPTYGLVSRYGLITHAPSMAQIGPLTKDVEDCALVLNAIAGYDKKDGTSAAREKEDYRKSLHKDIKGLKIGIITNDLGSKLHEDVKDGIDGAVAIFEGLGAKVDKLQLLHFSYGLPAYLLLSASECSSALARFDGVRYGDRSEDAKTIDDLFIKTRSERFERAEKVWMMLGMYGLKAGHYEEYYEKALKLRTLIQNDFRKAFKKFDIIISPTCPMLPFKIGEKSGNMLQMQQNYIYTAPVNLAGIPAISIPFEFKKELPIGIQIIGDFFKESLILQTAYAFEQSSGWQRRRPDFEKLKKAAHNSVNKVDWKRRG